MKIPKIIYNTGDITVTEDDDAISIDMYGIKRVEMTVAEWKMIVQAWEQSK